MQKKGNFATLSIESIGDHHSPESLILFILPYHQHYLGKCPLGFDAAYLSPRLVFGEHLQNPPIFIMDHRVSIFFPSIFLQPNLGIGQDYSWDFLPCVAAGNPGNPGNPPAKTTRWSIEVGYRSVWLWSLVVGAGLARGFWPSQALVAWRNHMLTG